jgi:hypothetical protein
MQKSFSIYNDLVISFNDLLLRPVVYGGTIFSKREILESVFPIDNKLGHEDWWIPLKVSYTGRIKYVHKPVLYYRIHDGQITNQLQHNNNWIYYKTRDISYYQKILNEFDLDYDQLNLICFKLHSAKIYSKKNFYLRFLSYLKMMNYLRKMYPFYAAKISFKKSIKKNFLAAINPKFVRPI